MEIKLKSQVNKNQAALIEFELKSLFKDFLVDNNKDFVTLSNLATKSKIPLLNNITIVSFTNQYEDISQGKCQHNQHPTVIDLLHIENPNVFNHVISTRHLEKVLLTRSLEEAETLLKSVETVPRNCLRALTSDYRWVNPAPNYRTSDLSSHSFMKNFKPVLTYENNENEIV